MKKILAKELGKVNIRLSTRLWRILITHEFDGEYRNKCISHVLLEVNYGIYQKNFRFLVPIHLVFFLILLGCSLEPQNVEIGSVSVGSYGILHKGVVTKEDPVTLSPSEQKKKEVAERLDTEGLLYTGKAVIDSDIKMLEPPEIVATYAGKDYIIAKVPPEIEFAVIPV